MIDDALIWEIVYRDRVSIRGACRKLHMDPRRPFMRSRQVPGRRESRPLRAPGSAAIPVAPELVLPIDDIAPRVEYRPQAQGHGRTARSPRELVVAHPLDLHRAPACRSREQGRIERGIVGAVVPVAARSFHVPHDDRIFAHRQRERQVASQIEYTLAVAPDHELTVVYLGDRTGRPDRGA